MEVVEEVNVGMRLRWVGRESFKFLYMSHSAKPFHLLISKDFVYLHGRVVGGSDVDISQVAVRGENVLHTQCSIGDCNHPA